MAFDIWQKIFAPAFRGLESAGRSIDKGVQVAIEASGKLDDAVDYVCENPVKSTLIAGAAVATGGAAFVAAPAVGAAVSAAGFGVAGGTLSGAAASSAGLAALGGGSLASGGLGMAGGTALITGAGAIAGGSGANVVAKAVED